MNLIYKIPYQRYKDYFSKYDKIDINLFFQTSTILNFFFKENSKNKKTISFFKIIMLFSGVILVFGLIRFLLNELLKFLNLSPTIQYLNPQDIMFLTVFFILIFILLLLFKRIYVFEMPYVLKELIVDREVSQINLQIDKRNTKNIPPLETNRFYLIAYAKYENDLNGIYRYVPGLTKSGSLSKAKKNLKSMKINDVPLLNADDSINDWSFKLINIPDKIDRTEVEKIEKLLKEVWIFLLKSKYDEIIKKKLKEIEKIKF
ncbi:MAG: hypothetical protein ACOCP4_04695 [Candidatus Woesearchaeota archaeon]